MVSPTNPIAQQHLTPIMQFKRGPFTTLSLFDIHAKHQALTFKKQDGCWGIIKNVVSQSDCSPFMTFPVWNHIGNGKSSHVFESQDPLSKKKLAIKVVKTPLHDRVYNRALTKEAEIIKNLHSRRPLINVINYINYKQCGQLSFLFLELGATDLSKVIRSSGCNRGRIGYYNGLSLQKTYPLAVQLFSGLAEIHDNQIVHGDIKPGNVILTDKGVLKISDFGLSERKQSPLSDLPYRLTGTRGFRAPELTLKQSYNEKVDVWAGGCTIHALLTGRPPFLSQTEKDLVERVLSYKWKIKQGKAELFENSRLRKDQRLNEALDPITYTKMEQLINRCFNLRPSRPSAATVRDELIKMRLTISRSEISLYPNKKKEKKPVNE